MLIGVTGLERLSRLKLRGFAVGQSAARLLVFLCAAHFLFWYGIHLFGSDNVLLAMGRNETWDFINYGDSEGRISINQRLARGSGQATGVRSAKSPAPVVLAVVGVFILGFSSIFTGINFIVTIHTMRPRGHDLVSHAPVPLGDLCHGDHPGAGHARAGDHAAAAGRWSALLGIGIFDPGLGGDPVLFQHFFWFYSHPAVYIMILPAMGIISEVISVFCRKHIFGYRFIAYSSLAIALIGFLVWGHHMFVSGQSPLVGMIFSALTFAVAIPSAIKVFNWLATMYKGSISLATPDVLRAGVHLPVRHRRVDGPVPRALWRSMSKYTTRTSSSPISITRWSAAR